MMPRTSAVNSSTAMATVQQSQQTTQDMLGKDAFLQLLVTQLRYQDPLSPMDDREFVSQMAQFSSLEQMQNLNGQMLRLSALSMLGQEVLILPTDGGLPTAGVIERVVTLHGSTKVEVGGQLYPVEWVSAVQSPETTVPGNGQTEGQTIAAGEQDDRS